MSGRVITFDSVHHALKAERLLKREGIAVKAITTPRHISSDCGVALLIAAESEALVASLFKDMKVPFRQFNDE